MYPSSIPNCWSCNRFQTMTKHRALTGKAEADFQGGKTAPGFCWGRDTLLSFAAPCDVKLTVDCLFPRSNTAFRGFGGPQGLRLLLLFELITHPTRTHAHDASRQLHTHTHVAGSGREREKK